MYAGQIVGGGAGAGRVRRPAHPYTRELLRSTISLDTTELHSIPGAPPNLIAPPSGCRFHPRCPDVMQVCAGRDPIEIAARSGPARPLLAARAGAGDPVGGTEPLERGELAVAEEA